MRRAFGPAMVLAVILGVAAIGYAAFNAGVERGRAQQVATQVVTEVEEGVTSTTEGREVVGWTTTGSTDVPRSSPGSSSSRSW